MMAFTLAFHIIFAVMGITLPLLMVIAESRWLKTKEEAYLLLAKQWGKATALLFAIGAVSGTAISFEMGLLWPRFMAFAGPIIGLPFTLEGFAFFIEAIFLGIYLFGWDRVPPKIHWLAGVMTALGAAASGVLVMTANAWMNAPRGFDLVDGNPMNINVWAAMFNPASFTECLHMTVAAFQSGSVLVASLHAYQLLKNNKSPSHRHGLAIASVVAILTSIIMPLSGDMSARYVAKYQPVKLAAMESLWETTRGAPLIVGGWPNENDEKIGFAIKIPYGLSLLATHDAQSEVMGLKSVPREMRPFIPLVHLSFDIMVGIGFWLMFLSLLGLWLRYRFKKFPDKIWFLRVVALSGPLGIIAVQTGWIVTEVGRQPWVIYNIMRTAEAVTTVRGLWLPLIIFIVIYTILTVALMKVLHWTFSQAAVETGEARS